MLRILACIAPSTATSRSASSKTRNGALPPSSIEVRITWSAHCSRSLRPTAVEPVKESFRARPSRIIGSITGAGSEVVTTLSTPSGSPASCMIPASARMRQRRLLGGLDHHRAAGGDGRADLAGAHRHREVPRRDEEARAHGLAHDQQSALAVGSDGEATVDPHRLLGEPAEELGGVGDLAPGLGQRLAHLQRHQQREVLLALEEQVVGPAQDVAALARRHRGPGGLGLGGGLQRLHAVGRGGVGDLGEHASGGGVLDGERRPGLGRAPGPADEQPARHRADDLLFPREFDQACCGLRGVTVVWCVSVVDSLPRSVPDGQPLSASQAGNARRGGPRRGRLPLRRGRPALPRLHRGHRRDQHGALPSARRGRRPGAGGHADPRRSTRRSCTGRC